MALPPGLNKAWSNPTLQDLFKIFKPPRWLDRRIWAFQEGRPFNTPRLNEDVAKHMDALAPAEAMDQLLFMDNVAPLGERTWLFRNPNTQARYLETRVTGMDDVDMPTPVDVHQAPEQWAAPDDVFGSVVDWQKRRATPGGLRIDLTPGGLHAWDMAPDIQPQPDRWRATRNKRYLAQDTSNPTYHFKPFGTHGDEGYRELVGIRKGVYPVRVFPKAQRPHDFVSRPILQYEGPINQEAQRVVNLQDALIRAIRGPETPEMTEQLRTVGGWLEQRTGDPAIRRALRQSLLLGTGATALSLPDKADLAK